MKLLRNVLIVLTMVIALLLITNSTIFAKTLTVNTDTLKLRKEPSTNATTLELLNNGEKLEYIEESGDWYKVKIKGMTGYVHKDYVKVEEDTINENSNKEEEQSTNENKQNEQTNTMEEENATENQNTVIEQTTAQENNQTENKEYIPKQTTLLKDTNCYILPLINSNILLNIKKDANITIKNEINGWLYIATDEIEGWVLASTVKEERNNTTPVTTTEKEPEKEPNSEPQVTTIEEKSMYVNTSSIYIRKGPGTNYEIIDSLILNARVVVTGEIEDWYQVKVDGKTGYIAKRLLSSTKIENTTSRSAEERPADETKTVAEEKETTTAVTTSKGQEIVNYAKQYLGSKYVYGGSGPSTFDCSGFTMYVYKHFGVSLSHSATAQSKRGTPIEKDNLMLGDLVFFKDYQTMDGVGHCGIYIGDGNFIHASSGTGYCVKISTLLSGSYKTRYCGARRII